MQNFRVYDFNGNYRATLTAETYKAALIAAKGRGFVAPMLISERDEQAQLDAWANDHDGE